MLFQSFLLNYTGNKKSTIFYNPITCQGTVVLGVNTRRVFTWMRKVVGSNLGDDNIRSLSSFVEID